MHHPWRAIRALVEWEVRWTDQLPDGVIAATRWTDRTLWFSKGLSQVERRCAAEHERQHVVRGPGGVIEHEERAVDVATARALISVEDLIHHGRWARDCTELADELQVTVEVLMTRMEHLRPFERAAVHRAFSDE